MSNKAQLKRQYAGSRRNLNFVDDEEEIKMPVNKTTYRRNSMRRASTLLGIPSNTIEHNRLKNDEEQDLSNLRGKLENLDPESLIMPSMVRRKSRARRASTFQGLSPSSFSSKGGQQFKCSMINQYAQNNLEAKKSEVDKSILLDRIEPQPYKDNGPNMKKRNSLLSSDHLKDHSKPNLYKRNSMIPQEVKKPNLSKRNSLNPEILKSRRKSSVRRASTFDGLGLLQNNKTRKYSVKDDESNTLVIKDDKIKPQSTEKKVKIPKLKCSLLQDYAKSRLTLDSEEDEGLLVPEKRLNLLMASPSITRRRNSLMPRIGYNNNNGNGQGENSCSENEEDEELPLLAIPMMMLRRASTSLGFKGITSIRNEEEDMILEVETNENEEGRTMLRDLSPIDQQIQELDEEELTEEVEETYESKEINGIQNTMTEKNIVDNVKNPILDLERSQLCNKVQASATIDHAISIKGDETNQKESKEILGFQNKSKESLLYEEVESIPVPTLPRANEPPLEYYPFALTESRNNILYQIAESIPIPSVIPSMYSGKKQDIEKAPQPSLDTLIAPGGANLKTGTDVTNIGQGSPTESTSTTGTPLKLSNRLSSPDTNQISGSTCSLPILQPLDIKNIQDQKKANSTLNSLKNKDKSLSFSNAEFAVSCSFIQNEKHAENVESVHDTTVNYRKDQERKDTSSSEISNIESLKENDTLINNSENEAESETLVKNSIFPNKRRMSMLAKSRSSFFMNRSPTVETTETLLDDSHLSPDYEDSQSKDSWDSDGYGKSTSLGNLPKYSLIPKLEPIDSESTIDQQYSPRRRSSSSSYDSIIEEYNEEDLEKTNATLVAFLTVLIVLFFVAVFTIIFVVTFSLPSGDQGRLITHSLCKRLPSWSSLVNTTESWCDERIFTRPFQRDFQCPCFSPSHKPGQLEALWPYTGIYTNN